MTTAISDKTIAFIGTGSMARAIIKGLVQTKTIAPKHIRASDRRDDQRSKASERYGILTFEKNTEAISGADYIFLAVKPQGIAAVLKELKPHLSNDQCIVSVAAGIRIDLMESILGDKTKIVRSMPNICSRIGEGATAISGGHFATDSDLTAVKTLFDAIGMTVIVPEDQMDSVTGLSGSGPAFIFMIIEALSDAGVKMGLSRKNAHELSCQTVLGAAKLVQESKEHPGRLKDMVCSPGGTAISAVHTLEAGGLRTTLINAVETAAKRAACIADINAKQCS